MKTTTWFPRAAPLLSLLGMVAAATAVMLAVRFYLIEPESVALACAANNTGWRCLLRELAVAGFLRNAFGITALISGAIATVIRLRVLAALAILSGIAGAVLYTFELSGIGLLLGALTWVHRVPAQHYGEQQA
jgi:hypothetical protein